MITLTNTESPLKSASRTTTADEYLQQPSILISIQQQQKHSSPKHPQLSKLVSYQKNNTKQYILNENTIEVANQRKLQVLICLVFSVFIVCEIFFISKSKYYNSQNKEECLKLKKWTIGSIAGKFIYLVSTYYIWRKQKKQEQQEQQQKQQPQKYQEMKELSKQHCFVYFAKLISIVSILGQLAFMQSECDYLQKSVICQGAIIILTVLLIIMKFVLVKIIN